MLRASLFRSRALAAGAIVPRVGAQWSPVQRSLLIQRSFADAKKPDETILPGSGSKTVPSDEVPPPPPAMTTPENPSDARPPPQQIAKTLSSTPTSQGTAPVASSPSNPSTPPTPLPPMGTGSARVAPPPPPPRKKRRFRRFLLYLFVLSGLTYGGGLYYALVNDNFHDFFTEYIPYGEEAVAFFEEREFKRRFTRKAPEQRLHQQVRGENKVTIPSKSGLSWRVSSDEDSPKKGSDLSRNGKHLSAVDEASKAPKASSPGGAAPESPSHSHQLLPKTDSQTAPKNEPQAKATTAKEAPSAPASTPKTEAKPVAKAAPIASIDNINIEAASEPVVQDVVKILNDIITIVNADNAGDKYGGAINKAKSELSKVIRDLVAVRETERKAADDKIRNINTEFDTAANQLMSQFRSEMEDHETRWREEYETEREKLAATYQAKLQNELDAADKLHSQKLKNALLEQSINLQRSFTSTVKDRVESERQGRLGKLEELSTGVQELEKLTHEWNDVIESNLTTQHLIVALEAVKAKLASTVHPTPFTAELAALKESAPSDEVIAAAIASIPPTAYQRGIPSPPYLIDRFRRVAAEVRKVALLPENAGVASHAASWMLSKVLFKKGGLPVGEDVESVLGRAETLLEEGDLDAAAREVNQLQGWAGVLSRDWVTECRRVLEVRQALDVIAAEARLQSLLVD